MEINKTDKSKLVPYDVAILGAFIGLYVISIVLLLLGSSLYSTVGCGQVIVALILMQMDKKQLLEAGFKSPSMWWCLIPPVYLWKRANILQTSKLMCFLWIIAFVVFQIINGALVAVAVAHMQSL